MRWVLLQIDCAQWWGLLNANVVGGRYLALGQGHSLFVGQQELRLACRMIGAHSLVKGTTMTERELTALVQAFVQLSAAPANVCFVQAPLAYPPPRAW